MPVITIDGPAGSGKSTVASLVAETLGFKTVNSGALYRALTYFFLEQFGENLTDLPTQNAFKRLLAEDCQINLGWSDNQQQVWLGEQEISQKIQTEQIATNTKLIADDVEYRKWVDQYLRKLATKYSIVADGRDMGSQVFVNAELKIYLTASLECRVSRRAKELNITSSAGLKKLEYNLQQRDEQDRKRTIAPLICPEDAVSINSSGLTAEQITKKIVELAVSRASGRQLSV